MFSFSPFYLSCINDTSVNYLVLEMCVLELYFVLAQHTWKLCVFLSKWVTIVLFCNLLSLNEIRN